MFVMYLVSDVLSAQICGNHSCMACYSGYVDYVQLQGRIIIQPLIYKRLT